MPGTKAGGIKAAKTNIERHGKYFYHICGAKGGRNGHTGGFAANPELAKIAGAKGGRNSRRGSKEETEANRLKREEKRKSETWRAFVKIECEECGEIWSELDLTNNGWHCLACNHKIGD